MTPGRRRLFTILAVAALCFVGAPAAVSPEEAARLGKDLTPIGAERAGNAEGTIPAWEGGITEWPEGYERGERHVDPYAGDEILFTITRENMAQHAGRLTAGHKAMLEQYPSFRMHVYPTRRSASYPERIYEATRANATSAELVDDGNGVEGAIGGVPFPIPKDGLEVVWNHLVRFTGERVRAILGQAAPTRDGKYVPVRFEMDLLGLYFLEGSREEELGNRVWLFKNRTLAPAALSGNVLVVHETLNQVREHRRSWMYNPGQRRVRRAPQLAYDNPGVGTDGLRTNDQLSMFNGAPDRYDWKLVGKREIYVPYNSYRLNRLDGLDEIVRPLHINPDLARYELHRVWVVEATLKPGKRHMFARRTFYIDEDSWFILVADLYDRRGGLWRVSEGHPINYYEVPMVQSTLEAHYDLQARRYLIIGGDTVRDFDVPLTEEDFNPAALRRAGKR